LIPPITDHPPRARAARLATVVIGVWISAQLLALARGLLPVPRPWSASLPWNMFGAPARVHVELRADGLTAAGERVSVPLADYFRYTRGATDQHIYDTSRLLRGRAHDRERRAFAAWLAARMAADGVPLRELRLIDRRADLRTGRVREHELLRWTADHVGD
jgi:hypothetical protein